MENELQGIRTSAKKATSKYRIINIVFGILSTIGSTVTAFNFIKANGIINEFLFNATNSYGRYEGIGPDVLSFILLIAFGFFYFCLCALINLLIDIYAQTYTTNELKILELKQNQDK